MLLRQSPSLSPEILEAQIKEAFRIHFEGSETYAEGLRLISRAIKAIRLLYGNTLRKDGKTQNLCHMLSVARDMAVCGADAKLIVLALFHDIGEDFGQGKIKIVSRFFKIKIGERAFSDLIAKLTFDHVMPYEQYLNELQSDWGYNLGLKLTTMKGFDGVENAKTIFEGMDSTSLARHINKAMLHARNWKKLNCDVYSYMLELLRSKGVDVHLFAQPTFNQSAAHQSGIKIVRDRLNPSSDFIQNLPDDGANTIIIYEPSALDLYLKPDNAKSVVVEYSSSFLPKEVFKRLLRRHFGGASISERNSFLLPLLKNKHAYFFQIRPKSGFDTQADTAFFRHAHKLSLFYPKYFFNSPALLGRALVLYDWLWRKIFYRIPTQ